jgi:all-beta uncharacterized protein
MKRWTIVLVVLMTATMAAQYKTSVARWQCAANSIAPTSLEFLWHGGAQDVRVSDSGCSWFAGVTASGQGWITLEGETSKKGAGLFSIVVTQNRTGADRRGVVRVSNYSIVVVQKKK